MRYRLLGRFQVSADGHPLPLGPPRQRVLLASLALHPARTVTMDWLVDTLWAGRPPRTARTKVQWYVSELRKALAAGNGAAREILATRAVGYELQVAPGERDLDDFDRLAEQGRGLAGTDPPAAAECLRAALSLWQGAPLADLPLGPWLEGEVTRLEDRRLAVLEDRFDAELAAGRPPGHLVAELKAVAADHPLRERFRSLLMVALYRCGRQAEALAVFDETRRVLVEQLGIEPGAELQRRHREVLAADPVLHPGPGAGRPAVSVPPRPAPAQLPHARLDFTGRRAERARLHALLASYDAGHSAVPIVVLDGPAGIGKTTLAVQFAHEVAGRFPDGQLFIDLHGCDPGCSPLPPGDTLGVLLRSLGAAPQRIPATVDERAAEYRSRLAGKRLLILLDDAACAQQVQPLLPGTPGPLVLVTGRCRMAGIVVRDGAHRLTLGALPAADAVALLARLGGPQRTTAEPAAAAEVARFCSHLPLALAVAGERVAGDPRLRLADLAGELAAAGPQRIITGPSCAGCMPGTGPQRTPPTATGLPGRW